MPHRVRLPASSNRRYPRLTEVDFKVTLRVRAHGTHSETSPPPASGAPITSTIVNISPEGACLQPSERIDVRRRDWVSLSMKIDDATVELPARVAWATFEGGVQQVGLKLKLEIAPVLARTRYARWIVTALQGKTP